LNNTNFKLYSQYYDLLYGDKDYQKEADYIEKLVLNYHSGVEKILLDLGSGTGKHGQLMAKKKFVVTGIEKSPEMVSISNETPVKNFRSFVGDIRNFQLSSKFNIITALFHVISYINTNSDLDKVFGNVYSHLESEGIFIFDVWYSNAVYSLKPETRIKRVKSSSYELTRIGEPELRHKNNIVDVRYQIFIKDLNSNKSQDFSELHSMRHYSIPEIKYVASKNHLQVLQAEEFLTGESPSESTWGVTFILKKMR
jgi:SAM-dependent methyltransferase